MLHVYLKTIKIHTNCPIPLVMIHFYESFKNSWHVLFFLRINFVQQNCVFIFNLFFTFDSIWMNLLDKILGIVHTQPISFLKSFSERVGSDIERLWIWESSPSHFISEIIFGKSRIRHTTNPKFNAEFLDRLKIDWWRFSNSESFYVGPNSFRHCFLN